MSFVTNDGYEINLLQYLIYLPQNTSLSTLSTFLEDIHNTSKGPLLDVDQQKFIAVENFKVK